MNRNIYIGVIVLLLVVLGFVAMVVSGTNLRDAFALWTEEEDPLQVSIHAKQGPQGAYDIEVYSCSVVDDQGTTTLVDDEFRPWGGNPAGRPDAIASGLTYTMATKLFEPNGLPGSWTEAIPTCDKGPYEGVQDALWVSRVRIDPGQNPISQRLDFAGPVLAGDIGPQGPQGAYKVSLFQRTPAGSASLVRPTAYSINADGEVAPNSVTPAEWLTAPPPLGTDPLWVTIAAVNPATDNFPITEGLDWTDPVEWTGAITSGGVSAGDITSVLAGDGLSGGGPVGNVRLDVIHPYTDIEGRKLTGIEDGATRVVANPPEADQGTPANLAQVAISGTIYGLPEGPAGPQGQYNVQIFGEASATSPPSAPVGGLVNADTGQVTPPSDTLNEIQGSAWAAAPFDLADSTNNVLWISQFTVNPAVQSGLVVPTWSTPFEGGASGPPGPAGTVGTSFQPAFTQSTTRPAKPTTVGYLAGNVFQFVPENTWAVNAPSTPTDQVWMILIPYQTGVFTSSIDITQVTTPVQLSGTAGQAGSSTSLVYHEGQARPDTPAVGAGSRSALTGLLSSAPPGWTLQPPTNPTAPVWVSVVFLPGDVTEGETYSVSIRFTGTAGQTAWFQFSSDSSSWHNTPQSGDRYLRHALAATRPDNSSTEWSTGVLYSGVGTAEVLLDELSGDGRNIEVNKDNFASSTNTHNNVFSLNRELTAADSGKTLIWFGTYSAVAGDTTLPSRIWMLMIPVDVILLMGETTAGAINMNNVLTFYTTRIGHNTLNDWAESRILVGKIARSQTGQNQFRTRLVVAVGGSNQSNYDITALKTKITLR